MGGGNGNKSAMKKARKGTEKKKPGSQLKSNEAAKSEICRWCMKAFQGTCHINEYKAHAESHDMPPEKCFPGMDFEGKVKNEEEEQKKNKKKKTPTK
ncbi:hypothetical protein UCREL1_7582 [Eutypa lata UCREL1]|uniref:Uncharacterized protein n=1 Tax=Eutypa lata (strain UCR-EL1) TaxID=1287681 RepID=M7T6I8_EUTLA|nr:hypothetical protein UCREL1_7582 [Eutypa lata UCREL1]